MSLESNLDVMTITPPVASYREISSVERVVFAFRSKKICKIRPSSTIEPFTFACSHGNKTLVCYAPTVGHVGVIFHKLNSMLNGDP